MDSSTIRPKHEGRDSSLGQGSTPALAAYPVVIKSVPGGTNVRLGPGSPPTEVGQRGRSPQTPHPPPFGVMKL